MKLTVAIPTFERNAVLLRNVENLLPQMTPDCELLILDNCSTIPVAETLAQTLSRWPGVQCRIIRNRVNIGCMANIIRCFEQGTGEWLWCLGDDDLIAANAVEMILTDSRKFPDATMFHYSTPVDSHREDTAVQGSDEFVEGPLSFNGMMYTPAGVYRLAQVLDHIRLGYLYAYSWGPQLAIAISSLAESGVCQIRSFQLITSNTGVGKENMWAPVGHLAGRQCLMELPLSDQARVVFGRKMSDCPSIEYIACEMMLRAKDAKGDRDALFMYDQIAARSRAFNRGLFHRLRWSAYRLLVFWPRLGHTFVGVIYRIFSGLSYFRRNRLESLAARDRFYRA